MKRMKMMGLCLVAVLAFAAVASATASAAAPEFGRCVAHVGGKFSDANCKVNALEVSKEKYEWTSTILKPNFTSKLKEGIPTLETVGGTKVTCKTESSTGTINSSKSVAGVNVTFGGCETSGLKCATAGQAEGVIVTSALEGVLGIEKIGIVEGKEVASKDKLALELHAPAGLKVAEFSCAGLPVVVQGSVLHPAVTNKSALTAAEKFAQSKGKQKPEHFAGGVAKEHILESSTAGGKFEQSGQSIIALATYEEKIEASSIN